MKKIEKTDQEWKEELSDLEYKVLRQGGTERPFTGSYTDENKLGMYLCRACQTALFDSRQKYHSGCGWPSFWGELETANISQREDTSGGRVRTELVCTACESHLGHIFNDGPPPTGVRYCINSVCLVFVPQNK